FWFEQTSLQRWKPTKPKRTCPLPNAARIDKKPGALIMRPEKQSSQAAANRYISFESFCPTPRSELISIHISLSAFHLLNCIQRVPLITTPEVSGLRGVKVDGFRTFMHPPRRF